MDAEKINTKQEKRKKITSLIIDAMLILSILFFIYTRTINQPVRVVGESMMPTYKDGQLLWTDRLVNEYNRFDVVVVKQNHRYLIKRVVGLPGEIVEVTENGIKINDEYIDDVIDIKMEISGSFNYMRLDNDEFFVLGDNRNNSADSRFYGPFTYDDIIGRIST